MSSQEGKAVRIGNARELAKYIDPTGRYVTDWTIRRWRLEAGLPHIQIGRRILYNFASVSQWLQEREVASVRPKPGDCGKLRQID